MANRCLLALCKVESFKDWLAEKGFAPAPACGDYEIARMVHAERPTVIIYKKLYDSVHASLRSVDEPLVWEFLRETRGKRPAIAAAKGE